MTFSQGFTFEKCSWINVRKSFQVNIVFSCLVFAFRKNTFFLEWILALIWIQYILHYFSLTNLFKTEYPVVHTHDKRVEMSVPEDTFIEKAEAREF